MWELMKEYVGIAAVVIWGWLLTMHPHAATGALAGCAFFLTTPNSAKGFRRFLLLVFTFFIGYAGGIYFHGEGPPYSTKAMLVSAAFSALAVVFFTSIAHMMEHNGDLPPWIKSVAKVLSKKGADHDSV